MRFSSTRSPRIETRQLCSGSKQESSLGVHSISFLPTGWNRTPIKTRRGKFKVKCGRRNQREGVFWVRQSGSAELTLRIPSDKVPCGLLVRLSIYLSPYSSAPRRCFGRGVGVSSAIRGGVYGFSSGECIVSYRIYSIPYYPICSLQNGHHSRLLLAARSRESMVESCGCVVVAL